MKVNLSLPSSALPKPEDLEFDKVQPTHYRLIASLPLEEQINIVQKISEEQLTVNQTLALVKETKGEDVLFEYPNEVFDYNVWEAEEIRDPRYGDSSFHGNCSAQVFKQCLWRYLYPYVEDVKKSLIVDPMAGSGTTKDVCKELGIPYRAFDIYPKYKDIEYGDARSLPLEDCSADLFFIHFPYWNMVKYDEVFEQKQPSPADLSRMNYLDFCKSSNKVFQEVYRILKQERFLAVLVGDLRESREIIDLSAEFSFMGRQVGFKLFDKVIKIVTAQRSRTPLSKWRSRKYNFHQLTCDTLLVFLKEGP